MKALKLKLLPEEKQAIERRGTDSVEAYDLYLMARSYWSDRQRRRSAAAARRSSASAAGPWRSIPATPRPGLCMAAAQYSLRRSFGRAGDGGQAALERALALDPDLAEARALKAQMLSDAGRHEEAAAEIAVALRLDPESYEVNYRAAYISYRQGRLAEAVPYFEKAAALDRDGLRCARACW